MPTSSVLMFCFYAGFLFFSLFFAWVASVNGGFHVVVFGCCVLVRCGVFVGAEELFAGWLEFRFRVVVVGVWVCFWVWRYGKLLILFYKILRELSNLRLKTL